MPPRPDLLITTRFGLGVRDASWFEHRLELIGAVTAPSIAAQTRSDFRWAVMVDPTIDADIRFRLERIVAAAPGGAVIDDTPYKANGLVTLSQRWGLERDGRILTGRLDDDDALHRETVARVYDHAERWLSNAAPDRSLALTFRHGLEWIMYDMVDVLKEQRWDIANPRQQGIRRYDYPFLGTSVFVLAKADSGLTALSKAHSDFQTFAGDRGVEVVIDETPDMWLYARHKQTDSTLQKAHTDLMPVDYDTLESQFGVSAAKVLAYVENADRFLYVIEKKIMRRRGDVKGEIRRVTVELRNKGLSAVEREGLESELRGLEAELAHLHEAMVGHHEKRNPKVRPSRKDAAVPEEATTVEPAESQAAAGSGDR
jgi:hypothetical protein